MEEEEADNQILLVPSPSLLFIHGEEQEFMTFSSIPEGGDLDVITKELPLELKNKDYLSHCDGWLLFWTTEDKSMYELSLWNAFTMENPISFPKLRLKPEQELNDDFILTMPPGNPDCMLILFAKDAPSLLYCRVWGENNNWIEQSISDDGKLSPGNALTNPVMCNGRICCRTQHDEGTEFLVTIDIKPDSSHLDFELLDLKMCHRKGVAHNGDEYLVESCGDLFIIYLWYSGNINTQFINWFEVHAVEVFKVDSEGRCHLVDNFKDRAFFVAPSFRFYYHPASSSRFSYPASESGMKIKGNHIYFTLEGDWSVYAFNMEDGTVLFSKPLPDKPDECFNSFWLKAGLRYVDFFWPSKVR